MFWDGREEIDLKISRPAADHFLVGFAKYPMPFTWRDMQHDVNVLYSETHFCVAWGKLFRRELWNTLQCCAPGDLRMAEDFIAVKKMVFSAHCIATIPVVSYMYRKRAGSATTSLNPNAFEIFRAYDHAIKMFRDIGVYDEEYANIHAFFMQSFIDHIRNFIPTVLCWRFYRQTAVLMRGWEIRRLGSSLNRDRFQRICRLDIIYFLWLIMPRYRRVYSFMCFVSAIKNSLKNFRLKGEQI